MILNCDVKNTFAKNQITFKLLLIFLCFCVCVLCFYNNVLKFKNMDELFEKLLEFIKAFLDVLFVCACVMSFLRHVVALSLIFSLMSASPHDIVHYVVRSDEIADSDFFLNHPGSFRINQFDQFFITIAKFPHIRWDKITWTTFITFT